MPRRSTITNTTNTSPRINFHNGPMPGISCRLSRSHSHTAAPTAGPISVPTPPITVCTTSWPEVSSMNASGGMKLCSTPSSPPASPANAAAMTNTASL